MGHLLALAQSFTQCQCNCIGDQGEFDNDPSGRRSTNRNKDELPLLSQSDYHDDEDRSAKIQTEYPLNSNPSRSEINTINPLIELPQNKQLDAFEQNDTVAAIHINEQKETNTNEHEQKEEEMDEVVVKDKIEKYEKQIVYNHMETKSETIMETDANIKTTKADIVHKNRYDTYIKLAPSISLTVCSDKESCEKSSDDNEDKKEPLEIHAKNEKDKTYEKKKERRSNKRRTLKKDTSWLKLNGVKQSKHVQHNSVMELQLNQFVSKAKILEQFTPPSESDMGSMSPRITRSKSRKHKHLKLAQREAGSVTA